MTTRSMARSVCGADCRFQRLYEGSQSSLNDMAGKHASALARVAALRGGLLDAMKQAFPAQYSAAERRLGHQLAAEKQDAVLLTFLRSFLQESSASRSSGPAAPDGTLELRAALAALGVQVGPGSDLRQWATAVKAHASAPVPAAPAVVAAAPAAAAGTADFPPPPEDYYPASDVDAPVDPSGLEMGGLEGLFAMDPVGDEPAPVAAVSGGESWDLSRLFDDGPVSHTPPAEDPTELFDLLYAGSPVTSAEPVAVAPPVDDAPPEPEEPAAEHSAPAASDTDPEAAPATREKKSGARTAAAVVKPELFPAAQVPRPARKRQPAKQARVTASAPTAASSAPEPVTGVATERYGELLALVSRPRPVFMSDLVAACGSPGLVAAWEQQFQDQGTASPVRVITPRAHHRERGSLVVPHSPELRAQMAEHGKNWWTDCLDDGADRARLRGARLYEAAVLLHRYADEIVSHKLTASVLSLRLNTPAGLTGVVMWVGSDSPTGPERQSLTNAVGDMINDRLVMLAVLTHESGARAVERLTGVIGEDAAANGWQPTMPVVASHSWDFASDSGASALAVL